MRSCPVQHVKLVNRQRRQQSQYCRAETNRENEKQRFHCGLGLSLLGKDGEKRERKNSGGRAGVLICQDSKAGGDGGKQQKIGV